MRVALKTVGAAGSTTIPAAEFADRRRRAEKAARGAGLDALIAFSAINTLGPSAYLTGYEPRFGPKEVAVVVLVPGGKATLIAYAYWDDIGEMPWLDEVTVKPDLQAIARSIAERLPPGGKRVGIAGHALFPAMFALAIAEAHPAMRLEDATSLLTGLAVTKSPAEIQILRECAAMTDAAVGAFLEAAREGTDEREIGLSIEAAMIRAGADRPAFPPLIFSGPRTEIGIGFPARRRLVAGDPINIVCGALLHGYKMDIGRVTSVGQASSEARAVRDTAAEMLEAMLATVGLGVPVGAIADASVGVVQARGMGEWAWRFGVPGYSGHGIGCWLDEPPRIRSGEGAALTAGMVLVLEARLGRPGHGGAALTDPIVVTASGAERLSKIPIRCWSD